MIRAVLFDFGGVILSSPFEEFGRYEAERGLTKGFLRGLNAANPDENAWARLERGEISFSEFCDAFEEEARLAGGEIDARELMVRLRGEIRPRMVEAVRRVRGRLKTGLLTNNWSSDEVELDFAPIRELFDVVLESSRLGVRKPDPRFYERACAELGIEPTEAVFLDDLGVNLKPARAMGMTTIKVGDPEAALEELEGIVGFDLR